MNLHEIKSEILQDYTGDFKLIGSMLIGETEQKRNITFKNVDDFKTYINAIDTGGYDSENVIFTGWLYKLNTPDFNKVNRSQYGNICDFKHEIIEYRGNNCFIPSKGFCFVECNNFITGDNYKRQNLDLFTVEKRRSIIMIKA